MLAHGTRTRKFEAWVVEVKEKGREGALQRRVGRVCGSIKLQVWYKTIVGNVTASPGSFEAVCAKVALSVVVSARKTDPKKRRGH